MQLDRAPVVQDSGWGAQVDNHTTRPGGAGQPDHHVVVPIAVHVSGTGYGRGGRRTRELCQCPGRGRRGGETTGGSSVDVDPLRFSRGRDEVVIPIRVHVPCQCDRDMSQIVVVEIRRIPTRRRLEAGGSAQITKCVPVMTVQRQEHIDVPVPVDVGTPDVHVGGAAVEHIVRMNPHRVPCHGVVHRDPDPLLGSLEATGERDPIRIPRPEV